MIVWSIIWMIVILMILVSVSIVYIFKYDDWYPNGSDDPTEQKELLQLPSNEYRQGT